MKNIKKIALLFLIASSTLFVSCVDDSNILTGGAELGGELKLKKEAITYVVGDGQDKIYDNQITIFQGPEKVQKIDVYKTFTTVKLGADGLILKGKDGKDSIVFVTSNKLLFKTLTFPAVAQHEVSSITANYNELSSGLIVEGKPVANDDSKLRIGDYFTLIYVSTLNTGLVHENSGKTKISVGTRLAGTYKVIKTAYWRIGVPTTVAGWLGATRIIESVDATTYRFLEFAGGFGPKNTGNDNTHYFTVEADGVVRTPVVYNGLAQILGTFPVINCEETPSLMTNACGAFPGFENVVIKDDINGKDRIYRTYGYYNPTGPREIYEVLEKVVD